MNVGVIHVHALWRRDPFVFAISSATSASQCAVSGRSYSASRTGAPASIRSTHRCNQTSFRWNAQVSAMLPQRASFNMGPVSNTTTRPQKYIHHSS